MSVVKLRRKDIDVGAVVQRNGEEWLVEEVFGGSRGGPIKVFHLRGVSENNEGDGMFSSEAAVRLFYTWEGKGEGK